MKKKKNIIKKISIKKINIFFRRNKRKIFKNRKIKGRRILFLLKCIHNYRDMKCVYKNFFHKNNLYKQDFFIINNIYFNYITTNLKLKYINIFQEIDHKNLFFYKNNSNLYSNINNLNDYVKIHEFITLYNSNIIIDDISSVTICYQNNFIQYISYIYLYKYIFNSINCLCIK